MALVDTGGDAWLIEYEACERLYGDIVKQLSERDAQPSKSDRFNTISASIRILLSQYNIQLSQLEDRMKASRNLTVEERERRLRLAENLASKFVHLTKLYKTNPEKQERRQLFGAPSWRDDDDSDVPLLGSDASVHDLKEQQKTILADQDRGLENLSSIIGRQKHIAIAISGEVESQNEIIDDIGARMDATNDRIRGTSNTVRNVNAYSNDDATWCHWLIIIVLLFCIIGVASS